MSAATSSSKTPRSPKQLAADERNRVRMLESMRAKEHAQMATQPRNDRITTDGDDLTTAAGKGLEASIGAHTVVELDKPDIGAFYAGFFGKVMPKDNAVDLEAFFGHERAMSCGECAAPLAQGACCASHPKAAVVMTGAEKKRQHMLHAVGRGVGEYLGEALIQFCLETDANAWLQLRENALRKAYFRAGIIRDGQVNGQGEAGLLPPLAQPTVVTSGYGVTRSDGSRHTGVDLRAAVGTPVRAPDDAIVVAAKTETEGGNYLTLGLVREDGRFAGKETAADDSGALITFAHLDRWAVKEGQQVKRGQVVAYTGNTGQHTSGPHLHVRAELYKDKAFSLSDERVIVDPSGLWNGQARIAGQQLPLPLKPGSVLQGFSVKPGQESNVSARQPVQVTVGDGGTVQIVNGTNVSVPIKAALNIQADLVGGAVGDASLAAGIPEAQGQVLPMREVQDLRAMGGQVFQGVGVLAGQAFGAVLDPAKHVKALGVFGSAAEGVGGLLGLAGQGATLLAPLLGAIPYVGPLIQAASGVAAILGPALGLLGSGSRAVSGALESGSPLNPFAGVPPAFQKGIDQLEGFFSGLGVPTLQNRNNNNANPFEAPRPLRL